MAARGASLNSADIVLSVRDLKKHFQPRRGFMAALRGGEAPVIKAVDGVSFELKRGQSLGIAGESGSGKTTTARMLLKLVEPTGGEVVFDGDSLRDLDGPDLKAFRRKAQLMFQNPYEALNPRFTIFRSVVEPLLIHAIGSPQERRQRVVDALRQVHLEPVEHYLDKHPHHLSGGQLQRVVLARALILNPIFLVADEPVSMLDVSIRAGILNTIKEMSQRLKLTTLYISHDLSLIQYMCDMTAVMYQGRIVELGPTAQVISDPQHEYTRALIAAVPMLEPR
ncbi:MAG: ABC transporter ATP-binding protein [Anaerolineae bacterium]|nr:ABC transporter ATP-binding protein [Anaerolineae bacterium]